MANNENRGRKGFPTAEGDVLVGEIVEDEMPTTGDSMPNFEKKDAPKRARQAGAKSADQEEAAQERAQQRSARKENKEAKLGEEWDARRKAEGHAPRTTPNRAQQAAQSGTPVSQLRRDVSRAGDKYMEDVRKSDILKKKQTPKERRSQLTGMHKGYTSMMMMACVQPLSQGLSGESLMSTLGMGAAMWALSPNFRNQVKDSADDVRDSIVKKIKAREMSAINKKQGKLKGDATLSDKWQKRLDKVERMERGDRDLYTAESAGMTEVALAENAYHAMREEGADLDKIRDTHAATLADLYSLAEQDGVGAEDIARNARLVIGARLEQEPELAGIFTELSHGQYVKGDPQEVRMAGTNETRTQWLGDYKSRLGQTVTSGSFAVREPMNSDQHQEAMADTMAADMIQLSRHHGADGLNMGMASYMAGWGIKDHPGYKGLSEVNSPLGQRLRAADTMRASMTADGISVEDQRAIYTGAYVDAMTIMGDRDPALIEAWNERFGENWKTNMSQFMADANATATNTSAPTDAEGEFIDLGEAEGNDPSQGGAAADAEPAENQSHSAAQAARRYRNARVNQNYNEAAPTGLTGFGSDDSDFRDEGFEMG